MRILILGSNYSAKKFYELFEKDAENIVFSTNLQTKNYIDLKNPTDVLDFCEANAINLVLIIDEEFVDMGLQELISSNDIDAFAPSIEAISITNSKSTAKKFIYKNKILTPKFSILEKPQMAYDYVRNSQMPLAIKPENKSFKECLQFCETFSQAKKIIDKFFASGNKKIIIEDYIEGKSFTVWALSNGFDAKIIGSNAKYQNEISLFEPNFVTSELKEQIYQTAILPTINSLSAQEDEYIGILGLDFILSNDNKLYLTGYNSFFDDLSVDFFVNGFDFKWEEIFDSCIKGDVFMKHEFIPKDSYMLSIRKNDKIYFIEARTKSNLELYLEELDYDTKLYKEAQKVWKF